MLCENIFSTTYYSSLQNLVAKKPESTLTRLSRKRWIKEGIGSLGGTGNQTWCCRYNSDRKNTPPHRTLTLIPPYKTSALLDFGIPREPCNNHPEEPCQPQAPVSNKKERHPHSCCWWTSVNTRKANPRLKLTPGNTEHKWKEFAYLKYHWAIRWKFF